jgi:hypothetical protein
MTQGFVCMCTFGTGGKAGRPRIHAASRRHLFLAIQLEGSREQNLHR